MPSKITSLPKRCAQKATSQTRIGHREQPMYYVGYMQQRGANIITEQKYREAISLYANTHLTIKEICEKTNVEFAGFSSYLSKYHRDSCSSVMTQPDWKTPCLRGKKGQTTAAHYKYKEAIAACDSREYIEYNISH